MRKINYGLSTSSSSGRLIWVERPVLYNVSRCSANKLSLLPTISFPINFLITIYWPFYWKSCHFFTILVLLLLLLLLVLFEEGLTTIKRESAGFGVAEVVWTRNITGTRQLLTSSLVSADVNGSLEHLTRKRRDVISTTASTGCRKRTKNRLTKYRCL